jgi:phosphoribosylformylglycinamidine (FGAM) synthase-like enzyme
MTTILQAQLVAPIQLGAADASVYTPPTQSTAKIGRAVFTNTTASATTITAGITTGGALGASTTMISARTIAPGESYVSPELAGAVLPAGSQLHAFSGAAASVTFTASGLLIQ